MEARGGNNIREQNLHSLWVHAVEQIAELVLGPGGRLYPLTLSMDAVHRLGECWLTGAAGGGSIAVASIVRGDLAVVHRARTIAMRRRWPAETRRGTAGPLTRSTGCRITFSRPAVF